MPDDIVGILSSGKNLKQRIHPLEEFYGDHWAYALLITGFKIMLGGMFALVWVALVRTWMRYIQAFLKINWTQADTNQMYDYLQTRVIISFGVFTVIFSVLTFLLTRFPFGLDALYYTVICGGLYIAYSLLNLLRNKLRKTPTDGQTRKFKTE